MSSLNQLKQAQKSIQQPQRLINELNRIVEDIQRCEKSVLDLQAELVDANSRFPSPRTTRQDVDFLTELLKCADKKLVWEKNLASLQERTPGLLEEMIRPMKS